MSNNKSSLDSSVPVTADRSESANQPTVTLDRKSTTNDKIKCNRIKIKEKSEPISKVINEQLADLNAKLPTRYFINKPSFAYPLINTALEFSPVVVNKIESSAQSVDESDEFSSTPYHIQNNCLMILETDQKDCLMLDSGSQISMLPYDKQRDTVIKTKFQLHGANNLPVRIHGKRTYKFSVESISFHWTFITGEIDQAIIGIDFMRKYGISINPSQNSILYKGQTIRCSTTLKQSLGLHKVSISEINQLLSKYPSITNLNQVSAVQHPVKHFINTNGKMPKRAPSYHYSPTITKKLIDYYGELIEKGLARFSSSPYSSPVTVTVKKNGSIRPVGDFRFLNMCTLPDNYNLPHVYSFNNQMHGSTVFSKIDLYSAFMQIPMSESDICKTAVQTPIGLIEFLYMPYGLRNASQTFQRYMDEIFRQCKHYQFGFIDDLIVHSKTTVEHTVHLENILKVLDQNNLKINIDKSEFYKEKLDYLGYEVSHLGIKPTESKVKAIVCLKPPDTYKELTTLLCSANFYCRFIDKYSEISSQLTSIKKPKDAKSDRLELNQHQLKLVENIKSSLVNATLLHHPIENATLLLETDASGSAMSAVLHQINSLNQLEPLYFWSRAFTERQQSMDIYRKELESLYQSIKRLNKFILGSELVVYTDNSNLFHNLRNPKECDSQKDLRRLIFINQYIAEVHYIQSKDNFVADQLSRRCEMRDEIVKTYSVYLGSKVDYMKLSYDSFVYKAEFTAIQPPPVARYLTIGDTSMLFLCRKTDSGKFQVLVPRTCIKNVIAAYHNLSHHGIKSTLNMITQRFNWVGIRNDIIQFIKHCIQCQQNKNSRLPQLPIHMIKQPDYRFKHIHLDLMGKMSGDPNYNYTLHIRDRFTGYLVISPLKGSTSDEILDSFISTYISRYGLPELLVTDNASNLNSETVQLFNKKLGIKHINSTPYHPPSNGTIERPNQQVKATMRCLKGYQWSKVIPIIELCFNNATTNNSAYTPAQLVYGCSQRLPNDLIESPSALNNTQQWNDSTIELFFKAMEMLRPRTVDHHNPYQPLFTFKDLNTCQSVWVKNHTPSSKLDSVFIGPYKVLRREERYFVLLRDSKEWKISKEFIKPAYVVNEYFPVQSS